ncbi:hypothetical protein HL42_0415 [Trichophyton rubrum]|nr:hypothetical protein HL42_0415 [Trichophyton rubrum]
MKTEAERGTRATMMPELRNLHITLTAAETLRSQGQLEILPGVRLDAMSRNDGREEKKRRARGMQGEQINIKYQKKVGLEVAKRKERGKSKGNR